MKVIDRLRKAKGEGKSDINTMTQLSDHPGTYKKGADKDNLSPKQRRKIELIKQEKACPFMYPIKEVWE